MSENLHWTVLQDDQPFAREALATIREVLKVDHRSLRDALLEEIVGLLRRANKRIMMAADLERRDT